jgi:hypothetical protein
MGAGKQRFEGEVLCGDYEMENFAFFDKFFAHY